MFEFSLPSPAINILNSLEQRYLDFKLGEEQRSVLLSIFHFIQDETKRQCTLDGFGGSGKTTLTKLIIQYLEEKYIDYILAAPTHKAKAVLSKYTDREATTVHQMLTLKPTIDIMDLDYKDLKFMTTTLSNEIPPNGVIIIDECSMINEVLFDYIVEQAERQNSKIIWIGDYAQICPVKERKLSKAFSIEDVFHLTQVYRQKEDNPILDVLYKLRSNPRSRFNQIESKHGSLILYNNWKKFIDNNIEEFKDMIVEGNPLKIKLIAYTNKRVEAFNAVIRHHIFENDDEYNVGDILMAYDSSEYKIDQHLSYKLHNSNDYMVEKIVPSSKSICGINVKGYYLTLYSFYENYELEVFMISKDNDYYKFECIAAAIEDIRLTAVSTKEKRKRNLIWVQYFKAMGSFLTPYDLIFDGRTVRNKSLDYGYAITSHKSQGSTYEKILVDMDNIFVCRNQLELRQLQYVAMSRTSKDIHMLIK